MIWNIALGIAIFVLIDSVLLPKFSRLLDQAEARLEPAASAGADKSKD